eukprot:827923_1
MALINRNLFDESAWRQTLNNLIEKENKSNRKAPPKLTTPYQDTIVFVDLDDTLFPTTSIKALEQSKELEATLAQQIKAFTEAFQDEYVLVVTNGNSSHVNYIKKKFPLVANALKDTPLVSARDYYEGEYPGQMCTWKRKVFDLVNASIDDGFDNGGMKW